jgi:hypothetical protein
MPEVCRSAADRAATRIEFEQIFKSIFRLENLRRAPGKKGKLMTITPHSNPLDVVLFSYYFLFGC